MRQPGQLAALLEGLVAGHPLHRKPRGVIGDGAIAISMAGSGGDHVVQAGEAVGESGMHVEVADDVGHLHQVGEMAIECGFDFATVLAQRRWDPRQPEFGVDFRFVCRCQQLVVVDSEQSVLGQFQPGLGMSTPPFSAAAQRPCSTASPVLRGSPTSHDRASRACGLSLPRAARTVPGGRAIVGSPGSRA